MKGWFVADVHRLLQDVRAMARSSDATMSERMRDVAERYAALTTGLAQRLRRCEDFAYQGRRSEAVQLAEMEPRLLELVGMVSGPEFAQWDDIVAGYRLSRGAYLDPAQAAAVNQAYNELVPLQGLLREHRRLALIHAPVAGRLNVLRQLLAADPGNVLWSQQIQLLEGKRIKELERTYDHAVEHYDSAGAVAVWQELRQTPWIQPPELLMQAVEAGVGVFQERDARNNLKLIARQLQQAVRDRDVAVVQQLKHRFEAELPLGKILPDEPLLRSVATPFRWLGDMEYLIQAMSQTDAAPEHLANQQAILNRWRRYLPLNLENAFHQKLHALEAVEENKQKKTLLIAYAVIGVLAIAIIVWLTTLG